MLNDILKGYFAFDNVSNLSCRKLSKAEVYVLSKGLKFYLKTNAIGKSILIEDLQKFGSKLKLKWYYRNNNKIFDHNPFKSKFNPPKNYAAIELYLSLLEEKLLSLGPIKDKYSSNTLR